MLSYAPCNVYASACKEAAPLLPATRGRCPGSGRLRGQGRVLYAATPLEVDQQCGRLLSLSVTSVGFDIEWRVTFRTGETPRRTAVIQLCYEARARRNEMLPVMPCSSAVWRAPGLLQVWASVREAHGFKDTAERPSNTPAHIHALRTL